MHETKTILITGGARRIGNAVAQRLHHRGHNVMIHFRHSEIEATALRDKLNAVRPDSCEIVQGDLSNSDTYQQVMDATLTAFGQLDALINNASSFYPTPLATINEQQWHDLFASNLKAPLFLTQYAAPYLQQQQGCIINIIDIYADRPLAEHPIYCAAKAGLQMLTKSLARDLAPSIRVNGVAPGAILWPENDTVNSNKETLLERIPLGRLGEPNDIAKTITFLIDDAPYISGQIIAVDGGRSVMP